MVRIAFGVSPRSNRAGGRRPPPDYLSRRVQLQVGVLVFLFLTVLLLMREARQPENWEWMWRLDRPGTSREHAPDSPSADAAPPTRDTGASIDTRRAARGEDAPPPSPDPLVSATPLRPPRDWQDAWGDRSLSATVLRGWSAIRAHLTGPQRDLLREGLQRQRRGELASPHDAGAWAGLLAALSSRWETYQQEAAASLAQAPPSLTPDQRAEAQAVLVALDARWRRELAALALANQAAPLPAQPSATLASLQQVLDQLAWQAVEDNTVLRAADREAWLRGWEEVDGWSPARASAAATPEVTFVQLFSQPRVYRGQMVRVSGTVRHGYRAASRDLHGPGHVYHVLWLRPSDGSNAPVVAYVREVPAGFPPLPLRGAGQDGVALREEVVVTGVFFKRWLYASRDGLRMAPLVLGRVTQWTPVAAPATARSLGPWRVAGLVLLAAALGGGLAMLVMRGDRRLPRIAQRRAPAPRHLPDFESTGVQPAAPERLRQLADEEHDAR